MSKPDNKKHKKKPAQPAGQPEISFQKMQRDHLDVLQNVEALIVARHRHDEAIDDLTVIAAMRGLIKNDLPDGDEQAILMMEDLLNLQEARPDVADRVWRAAYRMVLDSVHNHSTLHPGNKGYLDFIAMYLP